MLAAGLLISSQDAVTKWLTGDYPIGEVLFFRSLFAFVPIGWLVWREGGVSCLGTRNPGGHALRALLMVISTVLFVTSLSLLPLAVATAALFAGPIFVTAMAAPLLGERVGWRRWTAVLVGFAGVLVMLRPTGPVQLVLLLPVGAALSGALRDIVTRRLTLRENSTAITFYANAAVAALALATLPFGWQPLAAADVGLFAATGLLLGSAYYLGIQAFRYSEVAVVMPFNYAMVLWAALLGYLVWAELPDRFVVLGGALVVGSGLFILQRERRRPRAAGRAMEQPGRRL